MAGGVLDEWRWAVEAEAQTRQRNAGRRWAVESLVWGSVAGQTVGEVRIEPASTVGEGDRVVLRGTSRWDWCKGIVEARRGAVCRVRLAEGRPPKADAGPFTLSVREVNQWRSVADRLPDAMAAHPDLWAALGDAGRRDRGRNGREPGMEDVGLDADQEDAARNSVARRVSWIWGPPGTGKTRTLGAIAAALAGEGSRVLMCAISNPAADALLEAAEAALEVRGVRCRSERHGIDGRGVRRVIGKEDMAECQIVATSIARVAAGEMGRWDSVLVDEASMVSPPLAMVLAGEAPGHVVMAGDLRQLPPVVSTTEGGARRLLETDVFAHAGIAKALAAGRRLPMGCRQLRSQYRMGARLMACVNELGYADAPLRLGQAGSGEGEVALVDTGALAGSALTTQGPGSRWSLLSALAAVGAAETAAARYGEAVICTPYRAQAQLLEALVRDRGAEEAIWASTVHRLQGGEAEAVVLDLTDGPGAAPSRFTMAEAAESAGARLLTVAASRARRSLAVVANAGWLRESCPPGGAVARLLDAVERHGTPMDARTAVGGGSSLARRDGGVGGRPAWAEGDRVYARTARGAVVRRAPRAAEEVRSLGGMA